MTAGQRPIGNPICPALEHSPIRTGLKRAGLYELVRNWRVAHDLADGRPFTVVNLTSGSTLAATEGIDEFAASLRVSPTSQFLPLTWPSFLTAMEIASGSLPPWMQIYLQSRGLRT